MSQNPPTSCCTEAKLQILAAAERLFSERGFDGVSMNAVATLAGVSKANVFHHFGCKEELYLAVLQNVRRDLSQELLALSSAPGRDLGADLHRVAETYLEHLLNHGELARLFLRELLERRPIQGKTLAERLFGPNFGHIVGLVREAQDKGQVRADVNEVVPVIMLVAACVFFFQTHEIIRHLPGVDAVGSPQNFTRAMTDILLRGISSSDPGSN